MRIGLFMLALGVILLAGNARAQVIFSDDFESGAMTNWTNLAGSLDISSEQNKVPAAGTYSAKLDLSADGAYHNIAETAAPAKFEFWLYDDTATRAWGELRGHAGAGWADGALQHLVAIGKYNQVTLPGESLDATKYQGRISQQGVGTFYWFNLNAAGAPSRSAGWHKFTVERLGDGSVMNFYVDDVLGRSFTDATTASWDTVLLTSARAGTTAGNAWFDGVTVSVIPEPASMSLLALGALGLLARRRA